MKTSLCSQFFWAAYFFGLPIYPNLLERPAERALLFDLSVKPLPIFIVGLVKSPFGNIETISLLKLEHVWSQPFTNYGPVVFG